MSGGGSVANNKNDYREQGVEDSESDAEGAEEEQEVLVTQQNLELAKKLRYHLCWVFCWPTVVVVVFVISVLVDLVVVVATP